MTGMSRWIVLERGVLEGLVHPCVPLSSCSKFSYPIAKQMERPMALQGLYLAPTHSQDWNVFSWVAELSRGGDVGQVLCLTEKPGTAFAMVSCVVNILLATMNRVPSRSQGRRISVGWVQSMLDTKWAA
jgi:hypothetical protein